MDSKSAHTTLNQVKRDYARLINPSKVDYLERAGLEFVESKREGSKIWGQDGKVFFDCRDDAGVFNFGHRNPKLISTLEKAVKRYDIGNNLFLSQPRIELAKKLLNLCLKGHYDCVNFGVSGSEIVDFAIKMARAYSGKSEVISATKGYYGGTGFAISANGERAYSRPFRPLMPEFKQVTFGDADELEDTITRDTACVILEPILGHAGVVLPPKGYFQRVREICDDNDVILIVDEIQTGLQRTGSFLAIEKENIVPDMILLGKALSGGLTPISAVVYKEQYQRFWDDYPMSHQSSFGGNELACEVALKALELAKEKALQKRMEKGSEIIADFFDQCRDEYRELIWDFRQSGYLMCLEMYSEDLGYEMSKNLFEEGILVEPLPHNPRNIRIMLSLTTSIKEIQEILKGFKRALARLHEVETEEHPIRTTFREVLSEVRPH